MNLALLTLLVLLKLIAANGQSCASRNKKESQTDLNQENEIFVKNLPQCDENGNYKPVQCIGSKYALEND